MLPTSVRFDLVCSAQEVGHDSSSQHFFAGMAVDSVVLGCGLSEVWPPRKTHRQRWRNFASLNLCRLEVLVRYSPDQQKNAESLQKDASCENSRQRQRTRCAGQKALRGQDQKSRLRYATVRLQTTAPQTAKDQRERLLCGSQG